MRIISGFLKGKKIDFVKNSTTRPLKDSVKENIFNILKHSNDIRAKVEKSYILDLYSGIGSFGIECISRGAKNVTFVEINKRYLNKIISNSKNFDYDQFNFMARDAHRFIKKSENFDIIFADPPYELYDLDIFVENALKKLNKDGMLIIECSSKETLEGFDKIAKFGDTNLLYWKV